MNHSIRTIVLLCLFCLTSTPLFAGFGDVVDFGDMQLDKEYQMKGDYSDYVGRFTATKNGTLVVNSSSSGSFMSPYVDAEHAEPFSYDVSMTKSGVSYELEVTEGTVVYLYADFCMNDATITLSMGNHAQLSLLECTPADGSIYDLSGNSLISLSFNKYVSIGSASIVVGDVARSVVPNIYDAYVSIDAKSTVHALTTEGVLHSGDSFTLLLKNVSANNGQLLYGTDGTLAIHYVMGDIPLHLVDTQIIADSTFLSYWPQGDEGGRIVLTFDGELQPVEGRSEEAVAIIFYGDLDTGDYYQEHVPYSVEGNVLTADFSGTFRRPKDMVATGTNYKEISVKISAVRDTKGNYTYTTESSSLGAYNFNFPYVEVKADIIADFYPASGASLEGVSEIEMWITDYMKLKHEGPVFLVQNGNNIDTIAVANYQVEPDTDYPGAYLLLITIPEAVQKAQGEVTLTLKNVQCADGIDYSADLSAHYTPATSNAIGNVSVTTSLWPTIYNLKGQTVRNQRLHKGIYVVNGKKIIKK